VNDTRGDFFLDLNLSADFRSRSLSSEVSTLDLEVDESLEPSIGRL
jgi:hypothetical protein